jgi:hypothetical protein
MQKWWNIKGGKWNFSILNDTFFFSFLTCPHKSGEGEFELVTFASWGVVPSRLIQHTHIKLNSTQLMLVNKFILPRNIVKVGACWKYGVMEYPHYIAFISQ